jgi:hypothetical protein
MKILKYILFGILGLIALLLIVALFVPKQYTISVSTIINKPKQVVYDYAKILKNQEKYSIWLMEDPNLKLVYTGTDGTVGFIQSWNSTNDNVGEGEQQITAMIEGERIDVDLRFKRPFESHQKAANIFETIRPTQTKVIAEFYGNDNYPMNLLSFVGKKIIEDAEKQNLQNLKTILEK